MRSTEPGLKTSETNELARIMHRFSLYEATKAPTWVRCATRDREHHRRAVRHAEESERAATQPGRMVLALQ